MHTVIIDGRFYLSCIAIIFWHIFVTTIINITTNHEWMLQIPITQTNNKSQQTGKLYYSQKKENWRAKMKYSPVHCVYRLQDCQVSLAVMAQLVSGALLDGNLPFSFCWKKTLSLWAVPWWNLQVSKSELTIYRVNNSRWKHHVTEVYCAKCGHNSSAKTFLVLNQGGRVVPIDKTWWSQTFWLKTHPT